jgi:hypothetical protein
MVRLRLRQCISISYDLRAVHNQCIDSSVETLQPLFQDALGDNRLIVNLVGELSK